MFWLFSSITFFLYWYYKMALNQYLSTLRNISVLLLINAWKTTERLHKSIFCSLCCTISKFPYWSQLMPMFEHLSCLSLSTKMTLLYFENGINQTQSGAIKWLKMQQPNWAVQDFLWCITSMAGCQALLAPPGYASFMGDIAPSFFRQHFLWTTMLQFPSRSF